MGKIINNGIVYGGGSSVELDATLSIEGKAADAQAVGDAITARYNSEEGCLEVKVGDEWQSTDVSSNVVDEPTDIEDITPVLTNYTSVEGQCVYSKALSNDYLPWKAFDGNDNSFGACASAEEGYLGFQWVEEVYVSSLNLTMGYTHTSNDILKIKMQYFDGTDWLDVENSEFEQSITGGSWQNFNFQFSVRKKVLGIRLYTKSTVQKGYALFVDKMKIYGTKNFNYSSTRNVVYYNKETDFFEVKNENGDWESTQIRAGLNKLYLYDNGNQCTEVGGAWKAYASSPTRHESGLGTRKVMNLKTEETCMIMPSLGSGYLGSVFKENSIDLTGYNKLYVDWTIDWNTAGSGSAFIILMIANSTSELYTTIAEYSKTWASSDETERGFIDISALNGYYHIGFYKFDYVKESVVTVREVWVE